MDKNLQFWIILLVIILNNEMTKGKPKWGFCHSCRFLLRSKLLWGPERCLISSCNESNVNWQKQQLKWPVSPSLLAPPPADITFRWTEHRCFNKWAFCLNIATHKRQAKGFSPVWTLKWVFKFQLIPNCLPQYSQRYSLVGVGFPDPATPDSFSSVPGKKDSY